MLRHIDKNFQTYPSNRIVAMIDSKLNADAVVSDLIFAGFNDKLIDESVGKDGMDFLDPDGTKHGFITKMIRKWQYVAQGEELKYLNRARDHLKNGHAIVSVPVSSKDTRLMASDIMHSHHATDVRYYGQFYVENLN